MYLLEAEYFAPVGVEVTVPVFSNTKSLKVSSAFAAGSVSIALYALLYLAVFAIAVIVKNRSVYSLPYLNNLTGSSAYFMTIG